MMQVTVSVAVKQLEGSATHMQVTVSVANIWVTIFIIIMQMGVSVAYLQVVFSVMHYAHDCFYCNYAGDSFFYNYISFKELFNIPFSNWTPLFIKLTRKHLKALTRFSFYHFCKHSSKIKILWGQELSTNWLQKLFSTFDFPIDIWKVGTSSISRKGGILEKAGVVLEKGSMTPFTNNDVTPNTYNLFGLKVFISICEQIWRELKGFHRWIYYIFECIFEKLS